MEMTMILHFSFSLSLSLFGTGENHRGRGRKKDFFFDLREGFWEICEPTAISPLDPLPSLSLSLLPDPFFTLRNFTAFLQKKKEGVSSPDSWFRICMCRWHQKRIRPFFGVIDGYMYIIRAARRQGKTRHLLQCHHVIDNTTCPRWNTSIHTHIHIHTHSPEIWKEKRRLYWPHVSGGFSYLVCMYVCMCVKNANKLFSVSHNFALSSPWLFFSPNDSSVKDNPPPPNFFNRFKFKSKLSFWFVWGENR